MPLKLPPLRPIHQLEIYWNCIRSQPALTPYSSITIGVSWPVPGQRPDSLTGFLYRVDEHRVHHLASFSGECPSGHLTEVLPGQESDSVAYVAETPSTMIESAEYSRYYAVLADLLPMYAARSSPGVIGEAFERLLWQLEPHCLRPLYQSLNPDFFDWLRNAPSV